MVEHLFGPTEEIPEYYVDSVRIAANLYSFMLELGTQNVKDAPGSEEPSVKRLALIRMSPHHALILTKLLEKNLRKYQNEVGPINIPPDFYRSMEIEPD